MKKINKNIIKLIGLFLVVLVVLAAIAPSFRKGFINSLSAIYGSVLIALANQERISVDISALKTNPVLELAAQMKADDMAKKGYFSHNTPDGKTPWYWLDLAGYEYVYAGENLAVNFTDSEEIHSAWKNSKSHFLNIVNPRYTEIGIATSTGTYKGREAVFVVQMFGKPR